MTAVYDAWCGLKDVHAGLVARVAARHGLTADRVLQSSLLCVALHDVGKLSRNFKAMMRAEDDAAYKRATQANYRHEIASLWLVSEAARQLNNSRSGPLPGGGLLETMAVAGHHRFLADGRLFDADKFKNALTWDPDPWTAVTKALGLAREMFKDQKWEFPVNRLKRADVDYYQTHNVNEGGNPPFDWLLKCRDDLAQCDRSQHARFRELFSLLKGLLMTADWMASGAVGREDDLDAGKSVVRLGSGCLEAHMRGRSERSRKLFERFANFQSLPPRQPLRRPKLGRAFFRFTKFQADCGEQPGHVIAVAPTGSGKTEGSWLWALNQVERGHAKKIIILLPTMVTSNSTHDRLRAFFEGHGHEVGLVHSTADLVRESEADRADVRSDYLGESHYFRPVTVGTIDQLLVPLFHAGRWAMKTFAAADAAIVIDEVHAYEPHTLGLIALMIEQLAALGARFMVMSATMPQALRRVLGDVLAPAGGSGPGVTVVEDSDLLDSARNTWATSEKTINEYLLSNDAKGRAIPSHDFLDLWGGRNDRDEPLKILVVVNTVKRCQVLSRAFREFGFELTCYHSKFIFEHRRLKERRINKRPPRLLIATQVVEVSLDIDYDILLTECAPIDALAQRAGRVNRARRENKGRVVIHRHEKESNTVYGSPRGILDSTWRILQGTREPTERDLIEMVEEVYRNHSPQDEVGFRHILSATRKAQERQCGVLDSPKPDEDDALLKTRPEDYPQVSVIPGQFATEARAAKPRDRKRYELKVPVWYARKHRESADELPLCRMGYDAEFGAELLATEEHPDPGHSIL